MQSRTDCIRMGLWQISPSQLSTVQKDHHGPTYWSFSCLLLWVIFKTASLFKKKTHQNSTQPVHPGSDNTSTPELRAGGVQHSKVHGKPLCLSSGYAEVWTVWVCWMLSMRARTKTLTQTSDYSEYLNIEVKGQSGNYLMWYLWSSSALC